MRRARAIGATGSPADFEALVASYMAESLEDRQHAESAVIVAVAFLRASLQGAAKDPGTAGVVQALSGEQRRRFDAVDEKLDGLVRARSASPSEAVLPDGTALFRALSIPRRRWEPDVSPPAALLRAEFGIVPFWGREAELARAQEWLAQGAPVAVALVTGLGGRGKTRLAIEAATRAEVKGWRSGFVEERSLIPLAAAAAADADRLLVVVDYAEDEPRHLIDALQAAGGLPRDTQRKLRILLLARNAGDWWERVQASGGHATELTHHPATFLRMRLGELAGDDAQAVPLLDLARTAFRRALKAPASVSPSQAPCSREALLIFAQALLLELGEASAVDAEEAVLAFLLSRERGFWHRALERHGLDQAHWRLFELLVAIVTLAGGVHNRQEVDRLLKIFAAHFALDVRTAEAMRIVLLAVYGVGERVEPLQPDRLGELLVATHIQPEVLALAGFRESV